MKSAWIFALSALGLLFLANRTKSRTQVGREELPERERRPRATRMRSRHRNEDGLLDLNKATLSELKQLSGMDDDNAGRIYENRPYSTKLDLVARRIIPDSAYEAIKHSITVVHAA